MKRLVVLSIILLVTGCAPTPSILDDVDLVQGVAYDTAKDGLMEGTAMMPVYSEQQTGEFDTHAAIGHTSKYIRSKTTAETPKPIVSGQLRVGLYSDKLAKKGISEMVDTLYRDASIGNTTQLAVTEGKAGPFLEEKYNPTTNPALYISDMLEQNIENENVPENNLHVFLYKYYSDGSDPYLPLLARNKGEVKIVGMALFKGDRYVEKIDRSQMFVFKMMLEGYQKGTYEFNLEKKDEFAVVENIRAKTKYKFEGEKKAPKLKITIKMDGEVKEFTEPQNLQKKEQVRKIQGYMEESMEKQGLKMISKFKSLEIDPLSIQERYKKFNRHATEEDCRAMYKELDVDLQVEVHILQSGVIE